MIAQGAAYEGMIVAVIDELGVRTTHSSVLGDVFGRKHLARACNNLRQNTFFDLLSAHSMVTRLGLSPSSHLLDSQ